MTRIFVAGATGAVGRRLILILVGNGFDVAGTTRSDEKAKRLEQAGATPFVLDIYDSAAVNAAVAEFAPDAVIHQLTDLPPGLDPKQMPAAIKRNARIRKEGTRNLVDAAMATGAHRFIAQSIAWVYAAGKEPHVETDPLDHTAAEPRSVTVDGVIALERAVLGAAPMRGVVLRYGQLYGPGTGAYAPANPRLSVHVDAAAHAAFLAINSGSPGAYNIMERDAAVTAEKARRELRWSPNYRVAGECE